MVFRFGGHSDRGRIREQNEDAFLFDESLGLAVVADGMGGHKAGEVASQMAVELIHQLLLHLPAEQPKTPEQLGHALAEASLQIYDCGRKDISKRDMGSTTVAAWFLEGRALVAHVGDSRAYLCRHGQMRPLTKDHTLVQELVNAGRLTLEEAESHRFRNVLSRAMGVSEITEVDILEFDLEPGDRLLLCSDGLYGYASSEGLQQLLIEAKEPREAAKSLVRLANDGGGGDNITAVVVDVVGEAIRPPKFKLDEEARGDEPTLEMAWAQVNKLVEEVDQKAQAAPAEPPSTELKETTESPTEESANLKTIEVPVLVNEPAGDAAPSQPSPPESEPKEASEPKALQEDKTPSEPLPAQEPPRPSESGPE